MKKFAIIGAAGYIAPRHLRAIRSTGHTLIAALDKHDSVGVLDQYFPGADFFTEFERFDRHLEKLRRAGSPLDYLVVCSPNYLHDAHIRFGFRMGADVICEKPLVLNPWNLDALEEMEKETGRKLYSVFQLRRHPAILDLQRRIAEAPEDKRYTVQLRYITPRGNWYHNSWKGDIHKSGGIATNIGIHFFDLLIALFGAPQELEVEQQDRLTAKGRLRLPRADVQWLLSIDGSLLPDTSAGSCRELLLDGERIEFSEGSLDLYSDLYHEILNGRGPGIEEARYSIELVHRIRNIV